MKNYVLLVISFLIFNLAQAQEEKNSKLSIRVYGGVGYGIIENDNEPSYNLNSNNAEILLNYNLIKRFGIATGFGQNELSGNGFNSIGNFHHKRTMLKIPFLLTLDQTFADHFRVIANFGCYTQTIHKDQYRFLNNTQKNLYDGWNFGTQLGIGFVFKMFKPLSFGINYNVQSDISKLKTNNNSILNDKQRLRSLNSVGIMLMIDL